MKTIENNYFYYWANFSFNPPNNISVKKSTYLKFIFYHRKQVERLLNLHIKTIENIYFNYEGNFLFNTLNNLSTKKKAGRYLQFLTDFIYHRKQVEILHMKTIEIIILIVGLIFYLISQIMYQLKKLVDIFSLFFIVEKRQSEFQILHIKTIENNDFNENEFRSNQRF